MNLVKTQIKVDPGKLLDIYRQLKTEHDEYRISHDLNPERFKNYCFSGGWAHGMRFQGTKDLSRDEERKNFSNSKEGSEIDEQFTHRNEKCIGYLNDLLDVFVDARRGSFWTLDPGFSYKSHTDRPYDAFRMHIALSTNSYCYMAYENGEIYHIPVDGHVWLAKTDVKHSAWNMGDTARTHVMLKLPVTSWDYYANHHGYTI